MLNRRQFVGLVAAGAAWPVAVEAQPQAIRRVAYIHGGSGTPLAQQQLAAAILGLQDQGYFENQNLILDVRYTLGDAALARSFGAELLSLNPDVIVAGSNLNAVTIRDMTTEIPIVFWAVQDPIAAGLVTSFTRPGGNITGFTNFEPTVVSKYVELLVTVAPTLSRIAYLYNPVTAQQISDAFRPFFLAAAEATRVEPLEVQIRNIDEIEPVVASLAENPDTGIFIGPDVFFVPNRAITIGAINRARLPSLIHNAAPDGALLDYSPDSRAAARGAGAYAGRILNGKEISSLPVVPPSVFFLAINLRTAREIGVTIPISLLATADTFIE